MRNTHILKCLPLALLISAWNPAVYAEDDLYEYSIGATLEEPVQSEEQAEVSSPVVVENAGAIAGTVFDASTNAPLAGVTISVVGFETNTIVTGEDGSFSLENVPPGTQKLSFFKSGYQFTTVPDLIVKPGEATVSKFPLAPDADVAGMEDDIFNLEEFVVSAEVLESSNVGLIDLRRNSVASLAALSSDDISRMAASDVAGALTRVSGVTISDGKYAVIRGLGDRYASTTFNGVTLPSPDPDRQAVQLDLFPSGLMENIITSKTFTPDQPGNSSGGSIELKTKAFPEERIMKFSIGTEYVEGTSNNNDFFLPSSSSRDRFAMGARDRRPGKTGLGLATQNTGKPGWNESFSFSYGDSFELQGKGRVGVIAGLNYSKKYDYTDYDQFTRFDGSTSGSPPLADAENYYNTRFDTDAQSYEEASEKVLLGSLAGIGYESEDKTHRVQANLSHVRSGVNEAMRFTGWKDMDPFGSPQNSPTAPGEQAPGDIAQRPNFLQLYEESSKYQERTLTALQFAGEHEFENFHGIRADWVVSRSKATQEEPDYRNFNMVYRPYQVLPRNQYRPQLGSFNSPSFRTWRDIKEESDFYMANLAYPYVLFSEKESFIKTGFAYEDSTNAYKDFVAFPSFSNGTTGESPEDVIDQVQPGSLVAYDLSELNSQREITGYYLMADQAIGSKFRLIGGARVEKTDMSSGGVAIFPDNQFPANVNVEGEYSSTDVLPSLTGIYEITDKLVLRAAMSKTLARPSFKEFTAYFSADFFEDVAEVGNPNLENADITNYDIRLEYFPGGVDIIAVSLFYKEIEGAIEKTILTSGGGGYDLYSWLNNENTAKMQGIEFEVRKGLGFINESLSAFHIGGNLTFIDSEIGLLQGDPLTGGQSEADRKEAGYGAGNFNTTRTMVGQPEWAGNLEFGYSNIDQGLDVTLFYNYVGEQLESIGNRNVPDRYIGEFGSLDLVIGYRFTENLKLRLAAKNLTNEERKMYRKTDNSDFEITEESYREGRSYSASLSFDF